MKGKGTLCVNDRTYVRTNCSIAKSKSRMRFLFSPWVTRDIEVCRVRSWYQYDKKRGYKSELRIVFVMKKLPTHSGSLTWECMQHYDGTPVAFRAVVHILYVSVLWLWHWVKEDECGYEITETHAFKVNILAVATICSEKCWHILRRALPSNLSRSLGVRHSSLSFFVGSHTLWTAIAEKPCNIFEFRLNGDKVDGFLCCLTFNSCF